MQWRIWRAFSRPFEKLFRIEPGFVRSNVRSSASVYESGQGVVVVALRDPDGRAGRPSAEGAVDAAPAEVDLPAPAGRRA